MTRALAGVLNPGKPFTALAPDVRGVFLAVCEGERLEWRPWWCVNDGGVRGKPTRYAIHRGRMYVWPIPDRPYRIDLHADTTTDDDVVMFDCTPQWLDLYEAELKRVKEMVK